MSFGFDPRIILASTQPQTSAVDTMRSLADMVQQRERHQTSLADLVRQQGREDSLQNIYRQNAGNMAALPQALMQGGFGKEALGFAGQQSEDAARRAQALKAQHDASMQEFERYARPLAGVKDNAGIAAAKQAWRQMGVSEEEIAKLPDDYAQAGQYIEAINKAVIPVEKRAQLEHQAATLAETKRHNEETEKRPSGFPGMAIITGEGGAQYFVDPRRPAAPAAPVMGPDGKQIAKPQAADTKLAERNVGGLAFNPKNPPSADGAKKMASAAIAKDKIMSALDRMEKLYDGSNPTDFLNPMGEAASRMEADWKEATDQVRIIGEMGVPNGADYPMLAKQIPNPVGLGGVSKTPAAIKAKFGTLRTQINKTYDATAKAYKYFPEGAAPVETTQQPAASDPQVDAARQWLKDNPSHPDATGVREGLKARGVKL